MALADSNPSKRPAGCAASAARQRAERWLKFESQPGWYVQEAVDDADAMARDVVALTDERSGLAARVRELESALERVTHNFRLAVQGKPVRDMAETLAEVEAALAAGERETPS